MPHREEQIDPVYGRWNSKMVPYFDMKFVSIYKYININIFKLKYS